MILSIPCSPIPLGSLPRMWNFLLVRWQMPHSGSPDATKSTSNQTVTFKYTNLASRHLHVETSWWYYYFNNLLFYVLLFFFFSYLQIPVLVMVPLPMRSYSHSAIKKVLDHLRAWWRDHHMQFTSSRVMVQHLVMGITLTLKTMPTVKLTPTPSLASLTLFQVEYKTREQSWLGLTNSHLMRWRCFILVESS